MSSNWERLVYGLRNLFSKIGLKRTFQTNPLTNFDWITEQVAVGGAQDQTDPELVLARGIQAILNCSINYDSHHPFLKAYQKIPTYNGEAFQPEQIKKGIQFIEEQVNKDRKVLVACNAGNNRSVAMIIGWLCSTQGLRVKEALKFIQQKHPCNPDPRKLVSLQDYFDNPSQKIFPHKNDQSNQ